MTARRLVAALALAVFAGSAGTEPAGLPMKKGSLRFAVIGNSGVGGKSAYELAEQLSEYNEKYPFEFVLMTGNNVVGPVSPPALRQLFEEPYEDLVEAGVKFYAVLGNRDDPGLRAYAPFGMGGKRYYSFKSTHGGALFVGLDSSYMDKEQLQWLDKELAQDASWKICFLHHPLYSAGVGEPAGEELRTVLEPLLTRHKVSVVFSGSEQAYERTLPQAGVQYFVSGGAGEVRPGKTAVSPRTAKRFDRDGHFLAVEIAGDELFFHAVDRRGKTVDAGRLAASR